MSFCCGTISNLRGLNILWFCSNLLPCSSIDPDCCQPSISGFGSFLKDTPDSKSWDSEHVRIIHVPYQPLRILDHMKTKMSGSWCHQRLDTDNSSNLISLHFLIQSVVVDEASRSLGTNHSQTSVVANDIKEIITLLRAYWKSLVHLGTHRLRCRDLNRHICNHLSWK